MKNANPNFKTGIKTLTDVQIRNSLPGYDTLLKKFETVRENAAELKNKLTVDGSFDSLKYDNIFSILGGRGAGKTSVLNTLYQRLCENENNILMPVIMPPSLTLSPDIKRLSSSSQMSATVVLKFFEIPIKHL